jgi:hypothetical protein
MGKLCNLQAPYLSSGSSYLADVTLPSVATSSREDCKKKMSAGLRVVSASLKTDMHFVRIRI